MYDETAKIKKEECHQFIILNATKNIVCLFGDVCEQQALISINKNRNESVEFELTSKNSSVIIDLVKTKKLLPTHFLSFRQVYY